MNLYITMHFLIDMLHTLTSNSFTCIITKQTFPEFIYISLYKIFFNFKNNFFRLINCKIIQKFSVKMKNNNISMHVALFFKLVIALLKFKIVKKQTFFIAYYSYFNLLHLASDLSEWNIQICLH